MILVGHIHVPVLFNNGCVATALSGRQLCRCTHTAGHAGIEKAQQRTPETPAIARSARLRQKLYQLAGDPEGIRTPDLHRDRVAC